MTTDFLKTMTQALDLQDYRKDITFHSEDLNQVLTCRIDTSLYESFQSGKANTFLSQHVEYMKKLLPIEKRTFGQLTLNDLQQSNIVVYMASKSKKFRTLTDGSELQKDMKDYLMEKISNLQIQYVKKFHSRFIKAVNSLNINQVLNDIRFISNPFLEEKIPSHIRNNMNRRDLDISHQVMKWIQEEIASMYELNWLVDKYGQLRLELANFDIGVWRAILNTNQNQPISSKGKLLLQREQFRQIPSLSHVFDSLSKDLANDLISLLENHPNVDLISRQDAAQSTNIELNKVVQSGYGSNGTYFWNYGFDGTGEVVGVTDTGLDTNHCFFKGLTYENYTSYNASNRKVLFYDNDFGLGDYIDNTGHGTSVAGIIAGNPDARNGNYSAASFAEAGVAKGAKLYIIDAYNAKTGGLWVTNIPSYLTVAFQMTGATISSNSWAISNQYTCSFECVCTQKLSNGTQVPITDAECYANIGRRCCQTMNGYFSQSYQVDYTLNLNDEFIFVAASGNEGGISMNTSIGGVIGKNAITVGASSGNSLAGFSGRGPTLDGRMKPDMVSPSGVTTSTRGTECGLSSFSGTSCSTPGVAGTAALVRHYFLKDKKKNLLKYEISNSTMTSSVILSGSLVKAAILHSTEALTGTASNVGSLANMALPNIYTGYGRMNLRNSLLIPDDPSSISLLGNLFVVNRQYLEPGSSVTFTFTANSNNTNFRSTITWYDLPATTDTYTTFSNKKLVNDIDLKIETSSGSTQATYYGNGNINGNKPDNLNSVERISIEKLLVNTTIVVTVSAKATNKGKQSYSMIITGNVKANDIVPPSPTPPEPQNSPTINPTSSNVIIPKSSIGKAENRTAVNHAGRMSGLMSSIYLVIIVALFTLL